MAKPVPIERLVRDMIRYGLTAAPDPDDPKRTWISVDYGGVWLREGEMIYLISPEEYERRQIALFRLRQQYVEEGFDVVLDEESGLDMSVVVGEFENTANYYIENGKIAMCP